MRIVVKLGSNILAGGASGVNAARIRSLASTVSTLINGGAEIIIVSSGAVAAGMKRLGLTEKPRDIQLKQAAAAVGQPALMWEYEKAFKKHHKLVAQVLLTRDALSDRTMYINSKNTLNTLIERGVIPIINENDTVATDEIKFGDNDRLAAMVAGLLEADRLVILSDVDGLYSADPKADPYATIVPVVEHITDELLSSAGGAGSSVGTGGMYSKLLAARIAARSGIETDIVNGHKPKLLWNLICRETQSPPPNMDQLIFGTKFLPSQEKLSARKGWIAHGIRPKGTLVLDTGAIKALTVTLKSLLPSGIASIEGNFQTGDAVYCVDGNGKRIAKGLTNYSSDELLKIIGKKTSEIEKLLGYKYSDEAIHRDNIVILG